MHTCKCYFFSSCFVLLFSSYFFSLFTFQFVVYLLFVGTVGGWLVGLLDGWLVGFVSLFNLKKENTKIISKLKKSKWILDYVYAGKYTIVVVVWNLIRRVFFEMVSCVSVLLVLVFAFFSFTRDVQLVAFLSLSLSHSLKFAYCLVVFNSFY